MQLSKTLPYSETKKLANLFGITVWPFILKGNPAFKTCCPDQMNIGGICTSAEQRNTINF